MTNVAMKQSCCPSFYNDTFSRDDETDTLLVFYNIKDKIGKKKLKKTYQTHK